MRPRIRTIKPEMWADERVGALSRDARVLLLGMVTMADDEGRFRAPTSAILGHVFPYDNDAPRKLRDWVKEIQSSGVIVFYVCDGVPYGAFRHWRRHQKVNRAQPSDLPPPPEPSVVHENSVKEHGAFTERSLNDHGEINDPSLIAHSPTRRRAFRSDPIPVLSVSSIEEKTSALCHRLAFRIYANDPKTAAPWTSERWQTDMRLLVVDRGDNDDAFSEVERIIDWCQADSFWHSNILSPGKLRKQFTQLVLKSQQAQVVPIRKESPSDIWVAIDQAKQQREGEAS